MSTNIFCVDIGGTKTAFAIYDLTGKELFYKIIPTDPQSGPNNLINRIYAIVADRLKGVGIGVIASPGPLDCAAGKIINVVTMGWKDVAIVNLFKEKFNFDFYLINDCNAGALGVYYECKNQPKSLVYISLSTGIGGGIILDGKLYNGMGNAGELGHVTVSGVGIKCGCGKYDCVELYSSGSGIERQYERLTGEKLSCADIAQDARNGGAVSKFVFDNAADKLKDALTNIKTVLDPQLIVFGGSVCNAKDLIFNRIDKSINNLKYVFTGLGGKQVLLGAFVYAISLIDGGKYEK